MLGIGKTVQLSNFERNPIPLITLKSAVVMTVFIVPFICLWVQPSLFTVHRLTVSKQPTITTLTKVLPTVNLYWIQFPPPCMICRHSFHRYWNWKGFLFHLHMPSYPVININRTSWGKRKCSPALPTIGYCWLKHFFRQLLLKWCHYGQRIGTKFIRQWPFWFLYLPSAIFIALVLVGPSKWLKQIIQIKHNSVKNPIWSGVNQLAI